MLRAIVVALCLLVAGCGRVGYESTSQADMISSTDEVSCAISRHRLYCWGRNDLGLLGIGTAGAIESSPLRVGGDADWSVVAVGQLHSCALKLDGTLWCWGTNDFGQLGAGDTVARDAPVQVGARSDWVELAAGDVHNCAVDSAGQLWCWGDNAEGQLAQPDQFPHPGVPRDVPTLVGVETDWSRVSGSQGHSCGLRQTSMWCWGRDSSGQLAQGGTGVGQSRVPLLVSDGWVTVDVAQGHGCGIRDDGGLWCWGNGLGGQLGQEVALVSYDPVRVGTDSDWVDVSASVFHTCGIRSSGTMWCWGRSIEGQHGDDNISGTLVPVAVGVGSRWASVRVGRFHTCAIRTDGTLWCTGEANSGQLGIGTLERPNALTLVTFGPG